jgi:hypothetical protein
MLSATVSIDVKQQVALGGTSTISSISDQRLRSHGETYSRKK